MDQTEKQGVMLSTTNSDEPDRKTREDMEIMITNNQVDIERLKRSNKRKWSKKILVASVMLVLAGVCAFLAYQLQEKNREASRFSLQQKTIQVPEPQAVRQPNAQGLISDILRPMAKYNFNVGVRTDYKLQECMGAQWKSSFPDVDYAFLGYNILKGFPEADEHDPGFTFPIFSAHYQNGSHTADCRFSVPDGLLIIPDVSCDTSFTSKIVRNQQDLSSSLSTSAHVSGGGWGVQFSASAGYQESSSNMMRGEYVYVTSTASCNYYYSRLIKDNHPPFDPTFLSWVNKLNTNNDFNTYSEFFEMYGTHFVTDTVFGARFIKNHKMATQAFDDKQASGMNVAVAASYSGLFSVGGGFELSSSQSQAASGFLQGTTTETKTVGAPPPSNGDVMTWASTVQENPIPTRVSLRSMEELFTERYMRNVPVRYNTIANNIRSFKAQYCSFLKEKGEVDSCIAVATAINLLKTKLQSPFRTVSGKTQTSCEETCLNSQDCEAMSYCTKCQSGHRDYRKCFLHSAILSPYTASKNDQYQATVYRNTIIRDSILLGKRTLTNSTVNSAGLGRCNTYMRGDPKSLAFSYRRGRSTKCEIFYWRNILGLQAERRSSVTLTLYA